MGKTWEKSPLVKLYLALRLVRSVSYTLSRAHSTDRHTLTHSLVPGEYCSCLGDKQARLLQVARSAQPHMIMSRARVHVRVPPFP